MKELLSTLRARRPLIHCISNLVTAADCANILLAAGASPIMAREPAEMEEIVTACQGLVLNTGTPDDEKFTACRLAGAAACRLGKPVVLDPVGAGASAWRREKLAELLTQVRPRLIRANQSEVEALLSRRGGEYGVDCPVPGPLAQRAAAANALARELGCVVLLSGEPDLVADGRRMVAVYGGSRRMARITGGGCMLSSLLGAFAAVSADSFRAAWAASLFWKSCAAFAQRQSAGKGAGSFRAALFDGAELLEAPDPDARVESLS